MRSPSILVPFQEVIPGQKASPPLPIPRAQRGNKMENFLSINEAVSHSKWCREAKPSNVVEQSWVMVASHVFQTFRSGRLDAALSLHSMACSFRATFPFFSCLFVCYVQTVRVILNTILIPYVTAKDTHKCQHHNSKSEVSTAKQSKVPAKNLIKPTKLKSHSIALKLL